MNPERPQEDIPGQDGIGVLPPQDEDEDTGEEEIGGTDDDEADDLDDEDAEGGLPAL